jgi:hypothetical protein
MAAWGKTRVIYAKSSKIKMSGGTPVRISYGCK